MSMNVAPHLGIYAAGPVQTAAPRLPEGTPAEGDELRKVAGEFAAFFLGEVFKSMDRDLVGKPIGHGGMAEDVFQDMAHEERARLAVAGENGLTELVYQGLLRRGQTVSGMTEGGEA